MKLTETYEVLADTFEFGNHIVAVDLAFDVVLRVMELLADEEVDDYTKIVWTLDMLLPYFDCTELSFDEEFELFEYILKTFIYEQEDDDGLGGGTQTKTMDFEKDAELIFASFFQSYHLDLFEQQGKLHWRKFMSLLMNLHKDTPFKEVVSYRVMKVPNKDEASEEYIKHVKKMKRLYSLEDEAEYQAKNDDKLSALAARFGGE
ncbi:Gp15 family bacteriophage protein [Streptococcus pluranimalium]|uniref:Gp15 family bacteriophage protein n=1 Tax=Streptococcus pluranimalium TaxID=82348 RepID=UPI0039E8BC50